MLGIISWFQRFEPFDVAQDKLHEAFDELRMSKFGTLIGELRRTIERLERLEQITLAGSPSPLSPTPPLHPLERQQTYNRR